VNFLRKQWQGLAGAVRSNPLVIKFWPAIEKFLIAGPTLVGFLLGVLRYPPGHKYFEVGFQSFLIFAAYLMLMTLFQALDTFFFSGWPLVLGIGRSVLAVTYLALTLKQYFEIRTRDAQLYAYTHKVRSRLTQAIGNAG
jgi:hypothetical protein